MQDQSDDSDEGEASGDTESKSVLFWRFLIVFNVVSPASPNLCFPHTPVDFLRSLFSRTLGLGPGEKVLDELTLDGVARYIQSGACESRFLNFKSSTVSNIFSTTLKPPLRRE